MDDRRTTLSFCAGSGGRRAHAGSARSRNTSYKFLPFKRCAARTFSALDDSKFHGTEACNSTTFMPDTATTATIIVKPKTPQGWVMVTPRLHSEIYFHGRQGALHFARAYANLHRPVRICVLNDSGDVEAEEIFAELFRNSEHATAQAEIAKK